MAKVYIVSGCRLEVRELIKETDKSFIVEMRGAHNGAYPQPKRRGARWVSIPAAKFANTEMSTLCPKEAAEHLRAQLDETVAHHHDSVNSVAASAGTGLACLLLAAEG